MRTRLILTLGAALAAAGAGCAGPEPIAVVDPATVGFQLDKQSLGDWDDVDFGEPIAWRESSRDGTHLAYVAKKKNGKTHLVLDGQPGPDFDEIDLLLVPNPEKLAVLFSSLSYPYLRTYPYGYYSRYPSYYPPYESDPLCRLSIFSADGKHVHYKGKVGKKWYMVIDARQGPVGFDAIIPWAPQFSPDGQHTVYVATQFGGPRTPYTPAPQPRHYVILDGQPVAEFNLLIGPWPRFNLDNGGLEFLAGKKGDALYRVKITPTATSQPLAPARSASAD